MSFIKLLLLVTTLAFAGQNKVMFAPYEGKAAFDEMFDQIANAKDYAYITVYSWSITSSCKGSDSVYCEKKPGEKKAPSSFDPLADAIYRACENGAKVYVVINNSQEPGKKLIDAKESTIKPLERMCAEFKATNKTMHEKFVVVDDVFASNSSANWSGGAITRYSETFTFTYDNPEKKDETSDFIINALKQEFEVLFNYSKNPSYDRDGAPKILEVTKKNGSKLVHEPIVSDSFSWYSTSMNTQYSVKRSEPSEGNYLSTRRLKQCENGDIVDSARKCEGKAEDLSTVVDMVVEQIKSAKKSLYLGMNYILYDKICDAVTEKVEEGLDVRIITDNKQLKNRKDCTRKLSERYKRNSRIKNRLRYKAYSHVPSRVENYLQHSKYILIDFDDTKEEPITAGTKLISGSHNLSFTGEYNNFENMALYRTKEFSDVYQEYYEDFMWMYTLGRDEDDRPSADIIAAILEPTKSGAYKIHFNVGNKSSDKNILALTYKEYDELLKDEIKEFAPNMLSWDVPKKVQEACEYYNPKTDTYFGGRRCKKEKKVAGMRVED